MSYKLIEIRERKENLGYWGSLKGMKQPGKSFTGAFTGASLVCRTTQADL